MVALGILSVILLSLLGSLSAGFQGERNNTDRLECRLLTEQVLEEIQSTPFDGLLSFNGTFLDDPSGKHRARISAAPDELNLVRIEVTTSSLENPQISLRAVILISNPN